MLCFSQFAKMYEGRGYRHTRKTNEEGEEEDRELDDIEEGELAKEDLFNYVIVGNNRVERPRELPTAITLHDLQIGEPPILHKRTFPRALRYHKKNFNIDPHKFYLAELILYFPFRDENNLHPYDAEKCEQLYKENIEKIQQVKAQVMPFLQSV